MIRNQLHHVLITGHQIGVPAPGLGLHRQRTHYIVSFKARCTQERNVHGLENLIQRLDLSRQFVGHFLAGSFILGIDGMTKSLGPVIEYNRQIIG